MNNINTGDTSNASAHNKMNNLGGIGSDTVQLSSRVVHTKYGSVSGVIVNLEGRHLDPVEALRHSICITATWIASFYAPGDWCFMVRCTQSRSVSENNKNNHFVFILALLYWFINVLTCLMGTREFGPSDMHSKPKHLIGCD